MKKKHLAVMFGCMSLVFALWLGLALLYISLGMETAYVLPGMGFGTLAYVLSSLSLLFTRVKGDGSTWEVCSLPVWLSVGYFLAAIAKNTAFMLLGWILGFWYTLTNFVLLGAFLTARLLVSGYVRKTVRKLDLVRAKTGRVQKISACIAQLMQAAQDPEVRLAWQQLKERVDLGETLVCKERERKEELILARLQAQQNTRDKDTMLAQIAGLCELWDERTAGAI